MEYDDFVEVVSRSPAVRRFKAGNCLCYSIKPTKPKLYHFSLYKEDDSIVVYCDNCISGAKKYALRELDEKEYFVVQITNN